MPTPASTASYSGIPTPVPSDAGSKQCGSWDDRTGGPLPVAMLESVPAASFVTISSTDPRLKQVGTRQQYAMTISLSGDAAGVQVNGGLTDAQGTANTPVGSYFVSGSRQRFVATCVAGLIVPVGVGRTEVYVRWPVAQVNASWGNAQSQISNFLEATISLTVTP